MRAGDRPIYSDKERKLVKADRVERLSLSPPDRQAGAVRVTLETPLRLKFENRLTADLPFHILVGPC